MLQRKFKKVPHIARLLQNMDEVNKLVKLHTTIGGGKVGNKTGINVLNKSAIVLVVACWEAFIEDLAKNAFNKLLEYCSTPNQLPKPIRTFVMEYIKKDPNQERAWDLAGEGWKEILEEYKEVVLQRYLFRFNTPTQENIDNLFLELIGFKRLSKFWVWEWNTNSRVCNRLQGLIQQRHQIAHQVQASKAPRKDDVLTSTRLVQSLAAVTSNRVALYLYKVTKKDPWGRVVYGRAR